MRYQGGGGQSIPLLSEIRGVPRPPWNFYKVITLKAFDLEQVICDHRQVGHAGKNGDAPKEACLEILENSFLLS